MGRIRHTVTTQSALYPLCTVGQPEKENNYRHHLELIFQCRDGSKIIIQTVGLFFISNM